MSAQNPPPLLPKISLRLLIGVVTLSAFSMGVVQQALTTGALWAILTSSVIASLMIPFLFYIASYTLASFFSSLGTVAVGHVAETRVHTPTASMPVDRGETESR